MKKIRKISMYDLVRVKKILDEFKESEIPIYAGQTAFFTMLSFFPFMMLVFVLLNFLPLSASDFQNWILPVIPDSFSEVMESFIREIYQGSSSIRISFTVITAIWLSSKAFVSLQQGLNSMYRSKENRNFILLRIYAVLYSLLFALLIIAVLAVMVFGNRIHEVFLVNLGAIDRIINRIIHFRMIICISVLFLFFILLFYFLPNKKQSVRGQVAGAFFSTMAWILFSYFFSIYVDNYSNYASFYGAMTTIALIMVWLYGCMYMVFLGGFINYCIENIKSHNW